MGPEAFVGWIGGAGALAAGIVAWRAFQQARLIHATPPTPVAALADGLNEVRGKLVVDGRLTAPVSGTACGWWRVVLDARRGGDWQNLLDRRATLPCRIDDGSGAIRLSMESADVVVSSPERGRSGVLAIPGKEVEALLARLAKAPVPEGTHLRWREETLHDGDEVHAVGVTRRGEADWEMVSESGPVMVSDRGEEEVVGHMVRRARRWGAVALVGFGLFAWSLLGSAFSGS